MANKPTARKTIGPDAAALVIAIRRVQRRNGIQEQDLLPAIVRASAWIADQQMMEDRKRLLQMAAED
jgi:hypothetical protein